MIDSRITGILEKIEKLDNYVARYESYTSKRIRSIEDVVFNRMEQPEAYMKYGHGTGLIEQARQSSEVHACDLFNELQDRIEILTQRINALEEQNEIGVDIYGQIQI